MKRVAFGIATLLISALPVLADEGMGSSTMQQNQSEQKDECLLVSRNCGDNVDSIQERISRISHEIRKGNAVYTNDELLRLNSELRDAQETLDFMMTNSGS